ncbi:hypothetical protein K1F50_06315 [Muricauda oceani]|uniref:Uncharacterized protein n=1 Tax=Flagellimonas oceani TaxID=2698672 RepID=A0A6G7J5K0_9FLAO|nr:hypothetical protein [Allomuricauda oceani]MBW8242409.1 hypothetical protein [Allomuricauda oceani]QII46161.1 hypothetical protein GVT53_16245 [Allomuricauda oceani]
MKTFLYPIIALLLILSISASPIIPLLDKELGKTMVIGSAEEEKSSKVITIKKFDEEDTFNKYVFESNHQYISQEHNIRFIGYFFSVSDYTVEILDPPPRKLV